VSVDLSTGTPTEDPTPPTMDWAGCVKSLLTSTGSSPTQGQTVLTIVKLIAHSEKELLNHGAEYESFYSSFVALATHRICASFTSMTKSKLIDYATACPVIIHYLLHSLAHPPEGSTIAK